MSRLEPDEEGPAWERGEYATTPSGRLVIVLGPMPDGRVNCQYVEVEQVALQPDMLRKATRYLHSGETLPGLKR